MRLLSLRITRSGLLFLLISMGAATVSAQRNFGVVFDKKSYDSIPMMSPATGIKGQNMPQKFSLRPFCPVPGNQGNLSSCTAYAIGYGAMSISAAIQNNGKDSLNLPKNPFSAAFIYNQVKKTPDNCYGGITVEDALRFLKNEGNCRFVEFDTSQDCTILPNAELLSSAKRNLIYDYAAVLPYGAGSAQTIFALVNSLRNNRPVIVVFRVFENFFRQPSGEKIWIKLPDEKQIGLHCLLVTGYDMNARTFEVMSSWSTEWADGGFCQVDWDDMSAAIVAAYVLVSEKEKFGSDPSKRMAASQKLPTMGAFTLEGEAELVRVNKYGKPYPAESLYYNAATGFYEVPGGTFPLNTVYQLRLGGTAFGKYIYVFSCDAGGNTRIVYPTAHFSALSPGQYAVITVPSELSGCELSLPGENLVCVLYSERAIPDLETRLRGVAGATRVDFNQKIRSAFGDLLAETGHGNKIEYAPDRMHVKANIVAGQGTLVPATLSLQARE